MMSFVSILAVIAAALLTWLILGWWGRHAAPGRTPWSATVPFTGGVDPPTHAWSRVHVRYYPMTLLLIAFEMEMMFMYPWAVVYVQEGTKALVEMGMFLGILSVGILYAWREGALRWQ